MAAITYKCPNCGGGLVFDPGTQKYKCEYCLSLLTSRNWRIRDLTGRIQVNGPKETMGRKKRSEGRADLWKQFPAFVPAAEPRL